ncbi:hypothetical protein ACFL6U_20625 [Planctomycetota bacterium]
MSRADNIKQNLLVVMIAGVFLFRAGAVRGAAQPATGLPALNPQYSPIANQNRMLLFDRLVAAFDQTYLANLEKTGKNSLAADSSFYYLRQELQALIDMWQATKKPVYIEQASLRAAQALLDARNAPRPLLWHNQSRGEWPCFFYKQVEQQTGGHSQLNDFQGATGLLMVATALKEANLPGWDILATQVQEQIVRKWMTYQPSVTHEQLQGPQSPATLLTVLNSGRDKREHFAVMCLDLYQLGKTLYPYQAWGTLLTQLYAGPRADRSTAPPHAALLGPAVPPDWGLTPHAPHNGLIWYYITGREQPLQIMDTSHGNRTVWLACRGVAEGILARDQRDGLMRTLKLQIWNPQKGPFYFNNCVDGSNPTVQRMSPGLKGNLWFGWHRLAAHDMALRNLFLSIAYDLTRAGEFLPARSQNKTMVEAQLCYFAWGARLLASRTDAMSFP